MNTTPISLRQSFCLGFPMGTTCGVNTEELEEERKMSVCWCDPGFESVLTDVDGPCLLQGCLVLNVLTVVAFSIFAIFLVLSLLQSAISAKRLFSVNQVIHYMLILAMLRKCHPYTTSLTFGSESCEILISH